MVTPLSSPYLLLLQSHENEFVPLLVSLCVGVVESRGLQTQGIYRIPGNKASVTYLTEMINKDPKSIDYDDSRLGEVDFRSLSLRCNEKISINAAISCNRLTVLVSLLLYGHVIPSLNRDFSLVSYSQKYLYLSLIPFQMV